MNYVSLSEKGLEELQSFELEEINGGVDLFPKTTIALVSFTTNLFFAAVELVEGFKEGWNYDKK